jgi:hypothetical protein
MAPEPKAPDTLLLGYRQSTNPNLAGTGAKQEACAIEVGSFRPIKFWPRQRSKNAHRLWSRSGSANRCESMMERPVIGYRLWYSGHNDQEKAWRKGGHPILSGRADREQLQWLGSNV